MRKVNPFFDPFQCLQSRRRVYRVMQQTAHPEDGRALPGRADPVRQEDQIQARGGVVGKAGAGKEYKESDKGRYDKK